MTAVLHTVTRVGEIDRDQHTSSRPYTMGYELTDTDYGHMLLGDIDLDAQFVAIRGMLARNKEADVALEAEIRAIAETARTAEGGGAWGLDDLWVERLQESVYQDAAHSMAACGMLAPLLESVLTRMFQSIGAETEWPTASEVRRTRAGGEADGFWNPQIYYDDKSERKNDLISGIIQLAKETGLVAELPNDFALVVKALFSYRNRMFHNGFEWPVAQRESFDRMIEADRMPADWFRRSTSDKKTWIIYMAEPFITRCLALFGEVLEAGGRLARSQSAKHGWKQAV